MFPRYGWLAAVIPARAQRFRVTDPELAETLAHAGADLVERSPDVEISRSDDVRGEAQCAIVALSAHEPMGARALRGVQRLARSFALRRRIRRSRRALETCGYPRIEVVTWERRVALTSAEPLTRRPVRLAHRFPLNAVIVGSRELATTTAFAASVAAAEAAVGHRLAAESVQITSSGVIVAPTSDVILRVAVGPAALRIEEQRAALECLQVERPSHVVTERVPRTLAVGHAGIAVWSAESRLPGKTAPPLLTPALYEDCVEFLAALYEIGHTGEASSTADAELVATLCDDRCARAVRELGHKLDESLAHLPRGFGHGDFWNGNLLIDDTARLSGVVDWPDAGPGRLPLLDLLHLQANSARELTGRHLGAILVDDLLPVAQAGGDELLRRACRRIGLELTPGELVNLVGAYWLNSIAREVADPDRDPDRPTDPHWRKVNVEDVVHALSPTLRRSSGLADRTRERMENTPGDLLRRP